MSGLHDLQPCTVVSQLMSPQSPQSPFACLLSLAVDVYSATRLLPSSWPLDRRSHPDTLPCFLQSLLQLCPLRIPRHRLSRKLPPTCNLAITPAPLSSWGDAQTPLPLPRGPPLPITPGKVTLTTSILSLPGKDTIRPSGHLPQIRGRGRGWSLLKMQVPGLHSRLTGSNSLTRKPRDQIFYRPPGEFLHTQESGSYWGTKRVSIRDHRINFQQCLLKQVP